MEKNSPPSQNVATGSNENSAPTKASDNNTSIKRLDQIRDVIYDYVDITPLERIIIEDPYFQRLRFIYQNSSAYLTYPSNQLTRFSHSLGVMHIGGLMYCNGLINAMPEVRESFFKKNKSVLEEKIKDYDLTSTLQDLKSYWKDSHQNNVKLGFTNSEEPHEFVFNIYWQALRIACLCHDIGHLPFSHIFEMAIDEFNTRNNQILESQLKAECFQEIQNIFKTSISRKIKATDLHELLGAYLLCSLYKSLPKVTTTTTPAVENDFLKLCLGLAIEMFLHEKREYSDYERDKEELFGCYYSLISSDIDADRLDYILRDAKSSGINLGDFDYPRILINLQLVARGKIFAFLPSDKSISSIDQFFNYRYLIYEYVYYHHNVAKYDGLLIEILGRIFKEICLQKNANLLDLCIRQYKLFNDQLEIFPLKKERNNIKIIAYDYYTDCWLRNFLHDILLTHRSAKVFVDEQIADLIETFLFRIKNNVVSWAKNSVQIDLYLSDAYFQDLVKSDPGFRLKYFIANDEPLGESINNKIEKIKTTIHSLDTEKQDEELKKFFSNLNNDDIPELVFTNDTRIKFRNYLNDKVFDRDKAFVSRLQQTLRESLEKKGVILITKKIPPKLLADEMQMIVIKNSGVKPLKEASFYLENLRNISKTHFKYYFGFFRKDINNKDQENVQLLKDCSQEVRKLLCELIDHGLLSTINYKFNNKSNL